MRRVAVPPVLKSLTWVGSGGLSGMREMKSPPCAAALGAAACVPAGRAVAAPDAVVAAPGAGDAARVGLTAAELPLLLLLLQAISASAVRPLLAAAPRSTARRPRRRLLPV